MKTRSDAWSDKELKLLMEHYPTKGAIWDGWDELLPNRSKTAIGTHARKIGLYMKQPNVKRGRKKIVRPHICGECRFFVEKGMKGVGKCTERHARRMFGREPEVLARYEATGYCLYGECAPKKGKDDETQQSNG